MLPKGAGGAHAAIHGLMPRQIVWLGDNPLGRPDVDNPYGKFSFFRKKREKVLTSFSLTIKKVLTCKILVCCLIIPPRRTFFPPLLPRCRWTERKRDVDHKPLPGRKALLCLIFVFLACPASMQAGYVPPSTVSELVSDLSQFVGDFKNWNASLNNEPLLFLGMTPEPQRGEMVLLLFAFWLEEHLSGGALGAESTLFDEARTTLGNLGSTGLSSTGIADTSGNGTSLEKILLPISGPDNGVNSDVLHFSNPPSGNNDPTPFDDPIPAPAPASLGLLVSGAFGFLMLGMRLGQERSRRANGSAACLSQAPR
jgi:hypothetical protein